MAYNILVQTKHAAEDLGKLSKKYKKTCVLNNLKYTVQCTSENQANIFFLTALYYLTCAIYIVPCLITNFLRINPGLGIRSFQKNVPIFAFFSVLYKRTFQSLHSFPFFIKEHSDLCVLFCSLQKNVPIFAFFSVLYKRTEHSFWFHKSYKHCKSRKKRM